MPNSTWHLGREIPVAVIITLLIQTAGALWWAASVAAEIKNLKESTAAALLVQAILDRRQDEDQRRSEDRILAHLERLNLKMDRIIEAKGVSK